jgi:hypothetical protein
VREELERESDGEDVREDEDGREMAEDGREDETEGALIRDDGLETEEREE